MAVTGLIFIGFLIAHMLGNLKLFAGQESFDTYSHHLREMFQPILPYGGMLWILRVVLLVSVVLHIVSATKLAVRSRRAIGGGRRYQSKRNRRGVSRTYSSQTMRWGGVIIALFVVFHILHLTVNVIAPGGAQPSPYVRTVTGFQYWWVFAVYVIAMVAVSMHVRHGLWSALTTLGANTSATARARLNLASTILAGLFLVGFLIAPFFVLIGVIQ